MDRGVYVDWFYFENDVFMIQVHRNNWRPRSSAAGAR